ncbi:SUKH-4 family immunity protein [Streptomyces sp. NRRL B-1381]|uniref:SUKH-4 family immunity protein n=1 Tax=Streptomyces sp. NRRL B-1381 TaxID=1463829 RepID=UPI0004BEA83A|nr:SUKH-4 family immunity protein [Streptomyces sp. NRRL B-1381]
MLIDIRAEQVLRACGLTGVTYYPRTAGGRLNADTARFLSSVGLPTNKFFSPKLDLEDAERLQCEPSLKAAFEEDQATCPPEAEAWEILGEFQYATVALDPDTGRVYSFGEGEEFYLPMHSDVSCLVHAVIELEAGIAELKSIPYDDEHAREQAVSQLRRRVSDRDSVPFASEESEWSKLFEEVGFGMWG